MIKFLDLHQQYLSIKPEIDAAIEQVIADSQFIGGSPVKSFESNFAHFQGVEHCVGVGNGTDALEIALEALDLPASSEVIVPANTFIASSEAVTRSGLRVVFADIDPQSYLLDLADVEKRITDRTSAILCVHLYGNPCNMDELLSLARSHGLRLIEDCAQAHGAEWNGKRVGGFGDVSTFSFYPGKNLGAYGDGGAICTNDEALAKRCRMIANHGRTGKYDHEFEGRNSRLDGIQAAVLDVKLRHLDTWLDRRIKVAQRYIDALGTESSLSLPVRSAASRHVFHLFVVRHADRNGLADHLKKHDVQVGIHYPVSLPKLAAYAYLGQSEDRMFANRIDGDLLSLPIGDHLTDDEIDTVVMHVKSFCDKA